MADINMLDVQVTNSSQHAILQPNNNENPQQSGVYSWIPNHHIPHIARSHEDGSRAPDPHSGSNCYTAILTQTANLVQTLGRTTLTPGIDLVFEAERDFRALRHRLFTCSGHGLPRPQLQQEQGNNDPSSIFLQSTSINHRPCLSSDWPVLLSLTVLAEHMVGLLEEMFRLAAQSAHTLDKTNMEMSWSGTAGGDQDQLPPGPSARRMQRSCRSLWANPCVPPLVEASRDLRLGDFVVENPAKSKAMRRILTLRIERMLHALQGMRRSKWIGEQNARQVKDEPLQWGGSTELMSDAADALVDDLVRRAESLQGAMVLIRNDSMI